MGVLDGPVNWVVRAFTDRMMDYMLEHMVDRFVARMLQERYTDNVFANWTVLCKVGPTGLMEAAMRAETGAAIERPFGSPIRFSPWHTLLFNPAHLFRTPTQD